MLDLFGTNHDDRLWTNPEQFHPDRFIHSDAEHFRLIPQGGGDYWRHHRCAGEWLTVSMMELALKVLTQKMQYDVAAQNLFLPHNKMPTIPESGFVISHIQSLAAGQHTD